MSLRNGLSLGLSVLLVSATAWAQGRGFGGRAFVGGGHSFGGRGFGGQGFRGMSGFRGRPGSRGLGTFRAGPPRRAPFVQGRMFQPSPRRFGFQPPARFGSVSSQPGFRPHQESGPSRSFANGPSFEHFHHFAGSRFFDPFFFDPFFFQFHHFRHHDFFFSSSFDPFFSNRFFFSPHHFPHHHFFGFSPFAGSFGFSSFGSPFYAGAYPCDTRFSSLPFYCQPLYPNGPPSYDSGAYQGDDRNYPNASEDSDDYDASQAPNDRGAVAVNPPDSQAPQEVNSEGEASPPARYEPRRVVLTYDGRSQPAASAGDPLVITSGHHKLFIVSGKPE